MIPQGTIARSLWITKPGHCEIRSAPCKPPARRAGKELLLVRTLFSAISRGTEKLVFAGEIPPSERVSMRAPFQEGDFSFPLKYGYLSVGEVIAGPAALIGKRGFALFPHQDLYYLPEDSFTPIPEDIPPRRALLAGQMETALNALWDARPQAGDRVLILGAGVIGLLLGLLVRGLPGVELDFFEPDPARIKILKVLGFSAVKTPVRKGYYDLVFQASGAPEGLTQALESTAPEGTILDLSWYGTKPVSLQLGGAFHRARLTIRASQVGALSAQARKRWTRAARLELALGLLAEPSLDLLLGEETPFAELAARYAEILADPASLCHVITY